jgi:RNA polymerase sigma-70 factor, ECF subfamily
MNAPSSQRAEAEGFFDALYAEHHRVLYAYLFGQTGNRETAADLLQETFTRVWQHLEQARGVPVERRRYWLLATARNLVLDMRRRHEVRSRHETALQEQAHQLQQSDNPETAVLRKEQLSAIDAAIAALPDDLRLVLTLHLLGEMTSAQIGDLLQRPSGTVRYQLSQARKSLAAQLRRDDAN